MKLEDRAVIAVSGPDARDFLQGLITNDIREMGSQALRYAALLTPQGKILFDFLVSEQDGAIVLDCAAESRDLLVKRLSLYRLRAKVEIAPQADLAVLWREATDANPSFRPDPRHTGLGARAIMLAGDAPPGGQRFASVRLDNGIPEGRDFGQDKVFALDGGLDELHGIAFDKGCYVGQELTARMKHRGTARKRLLPICTASGDALPPAGTSVMGGGSEIASVHSVYGNRGFALVRLDRLAEAGSAPLRAQDMGVTIAKPDWLFA